jgi:hypothetical protein
MNIPPKKFPGIFGGHLISMNVLKKEDKSYTLRL